MRYAIEKQEKIQKELQLNYVDVIINNQFLNFLTPSVVKILDILFNLFSHPCYLLKKQEFQIDLRLLNYTY